MTEFRRFALFQLVVAGLTAVAVTLVYVATWNPMTALAGFALLGLQGLRRVIFPGSPASPVQDERDRSIHQSAMVVSHVALWLGLVAWGVAVPIIFGDSDGVPLVWVAPVVWTAWWLVTVARSVAILVLDGRGA